MIERRCFIAAALCAMAWLYASAANSSYNAVTAASKLEFTGIQAGAEFTGIFRLSAVSVQFDPAAPEQARIDAQIQLVSVDLKEQGPNAR